MIIRALMCGLLLSSLVAAQDAAQDKDIVRGKNWVSMEPAALTSIDRGRPGTVQLEFRVARGFHINSNQPRQVYLKKTELQLDAPTDMVIAGVTYPPGTDRSFPFAPSDKLNVYSGDFAVDVTVRPLSTVLPAKYAVHGVLKYQACDNAACYPPKQLPVMFEVKVIKGVVRHKKNPAQSPHAHG